MSVRKNQSKFATEYLRENFIIKNIVISMNKCIYQTRKKEETYRYIIIKTSKRIFTHCELYSEIELSHWILRIEKLFLF